MIELINLAVVNSIAFFISLSYLVLILYQTFKRLSITFFFILFCFFLFF
nr:MAG TPA: hypothetical protein [Caudoviricetes sp.]